MNINRSHPPHGGRAAAENFHKSSTEGTERRRDVPQTKAERLEAEERKKNPTDMHRDPNRPWNRFKKHPSEWSNQLLQQTVATRHRTVLNANSGLQTLPLGMLPLGTLGNAQKPGPAGLGGGGETCREDVSEARRRKLWLVQKRSGGRVGGDGREQN